MEGLLTLFKDDNRRGLTSERHIVRSKRQQQLGEAAGKLGNALRRDDGRKRVGRQAVVFLAGCRRRSSQKIIEAFCCAQAELRFPPQCTGP